MVLRVMLRMKIDVARLWKSLSNISYLKDLCVLQRKKSVDVFIVGGIIRDLLLNRVSVKEVVEIDFAVSGEVKDFTQFLSCQLKGHFVILDEKSKTFRIVFDGEKPYQFDFSQFRGANIAEDLYLRDFTVNALALDLKGLRDKNLFKLIDPWGGLEDMKKKTIRVVSEKSFIDDPLRIVRAFTFSQELGFRIAPFTESLIKKEASLLSGVAGERITEQLARILETPFSYEMIRKMDGLGVLDKIFPLIIGMRGVEQGPYHHLDVWKHSLRTLKELEKLLAQLYSKKLIGKRIREYLEERIAGVRKRLFVLKLGALFHDLGKPWAKEITADGKIRFIGHEKLGAELACKIIERLKLSSREENILIKLINLHLRPGYLVDTKDVSPRAKLRFFRVGGEESIALILVALADKFSTRGPLTTSQSRREFKKYLLHLIQAYFYEQDIVKPPRILNGEEVMQILNISPGPLVGKILKTLEEAQVEKRIKDKKEAEDFVRYLYKSVGEIKEKNNGALQG
ncbi:MAG: HD domain-containing protein [Candidatus Omnitrophica bacterium]|nr:HD domain-containing protein [Candidatus Omnitrophota bacterium]